MNHHCHALGCSNPCPPRMLMCRACWALVPADIQAEVYRTVGLRDRARANRTWAPWWRAQARAIHHVATLQYPKGDPEPYLTRELAFADKLDALDT